METNMTEIETAKLENTILKTKQNKQVERSAATCFRFLVNLQLRVPLNNNIEKKEVKI